MRSWGSREDAAVVDEPFYARYLRVTGARHPGRDEVIAAGETDYGAIVEAMVGPIPGGKRIYYQKQMAHHILPGDDLSWVRGVVSCFLIRDPAEMIASFVKVVADPSPEQLGLPQQAELFELERRRTGRRPIVLDARDVLLDPRGTLGAWCEALSVPFDAAMLRWERGPRATDGVWARHWYAAVHESTGFEPYRERKAEVPAHLRGVLSACRGWYDALYEHRLGA